MANHVGRAHFLSNSGLDAWPGPNTTGVPGGTSLTPISGIYTVTVDGTTVQNLDITGSLSIQASNVLVRNCRIRGTVDYHVVLQTAGHSNITIQNCEVDGQGIVQYGIALQDDAVVQGCKIVNCVDGCTHFGNSSTIEDNYIQVTMRVPGPPDPDHPDGIDYNGGGTGPYVWRHNRIVGYPNATSCIGMYPDFGACTDILVENNLLSGGGFSIYGGESSSLASGSIPSFIRIIGNRWLDDKFPGTGGEFGPFAYFNVHRTGNVWSDNRFYNTTELIDPD